MTGAAPRFVLATVGTDHHPFDRFVDWIDSWHTGNPGVDVFVQRGTTTRVPRCSSAQWLEPSEFDAMVRRADAIVCHGGPSTIMEARRAGVVPVVVPRDPAKGEHVDEHQLRFTDFLARKGVILPARSRDELTTQLDKAVGGEVEPLVGGAPADTLARVQAEIDRLMATPPRRWPTLMTWGRRCS